MAGRPGGVDAAGPVASFAETLHIEEDNWALTSVMTDPEIDYWMWDIFYTYPSAPTLTRSFTVTTPDVADGAPSASPRVHLQGSIISGVEPNHLVELRLNGTQLGAVWSWNGHDAYDLEAAFPAALLNSGDNTVEITALLADPEVQADANRFRDLSREYAQVEPVSACYRRYTAAEAELGAAEEMLADPEMAELAAEACTEARHTLGELEPALQRLLLPRDPNDERNAYLEVRAGTGGAEAALFAGDLLRMYLRYAEQQRWKTETISESVGERERLAHLLDAIILVLSLLVVPVWVEVLAPLAEFGDRAVAVAKHRLMEERFVLPDRRVLFELPRDLLGEGLADARRDFGAAELLHRK